MSHIIDVNKVHGIEILLDVLQSDPLEEMRWISEVVNLDLFIPHHHTRFPNPTQCSFEPCFVMDYLRHSYDKDWIND